VVAIAVVALVAWGFQPRPIAVEMVTASRQPMRVTIEEEGKTRVKDRFVVHAPVAGYVRRIHLAVGDVVRAGQVVALLDPQPQRAMALDPRTRAETQARVERAEASLLEAQSRKGAAHVDLRYWEAQVARIERLVRSGDLPAEQLDRTRTEKQRVDATLAALDRAVGVAEAEVRASRASLLEPSTTELRPKGDQVRVSSPVGGRVLQVVRKSEGPVQAGEPLVELGNARSLEVAVDVLSADAVKLQPGTRLLLERWGGEHPLEGVVRTVEPTAFTKVSALGVEEQRVRVIADITSPEAEWGRLGDGYRVEAKFILWEEQNVLQAPASALFRSNGGWAVFVREGDSARRREVKIGQRNGLSAQVLDGLTEGAEIVRYPDDTVEEGTLITVRTLR
jgi:HlyD family secretion protein